MGTGTDNNSWEQEQQRTKFENRNMDQEQKTGKCAVLLLGITVVRITVNYRNQQNLVCVIII